MQLSSTGDHAAPADTTPPSGEFIYLPLNQIIVAEQIRSRVDTAGGAFKALCESIRVNGVLEPILVARLDAGFVMISGTRRRLACLALGLATIPARILENMEEREAALGVQLTENLHRENLDPIDEAASYARYFQIKRGDCTVDEMLIIFTLLDRDPVRVDTPSSEAASALAAIAGKSLTTLRRTLSLLKLPEEIQEALRSGAIGLIHGYLFATEIDNPGLMEIFHAIITKPVTYEELKRRLARARKEGAGTVAVAETNAVARYKRGLKSIRVSVQRLQTALTTAEVDEVLAELHDLTTLFERLRAETSAEIISPEMIPG